jgi:hypothetical protein
LSQLRTSVPKYRASRNAVSAVMPDRSRTMLRIRPSLTLQCPGQCRARQAQRAQEVFAQ